MSRVKVKASKSGQGERLELVLDGDNFVPSPTTIEDERREDKDCFGYHDDDRRRHRREYRHGEDEMVDATTKKTMVEYLDDGHSESTCETDNRAWGSSRLGGSGSLSEVRSATTWTSEDDVDGYDVDGMDAMMAKMETGVDSTNPPPVDDLGSSSGEDGGDDYVMDGDAASPSVMGAASFEGAWRMGGGGENGDKGCNIAVEGGGSEDQGDYVDDHRDGKEEEKGDHVVDSGEMQELSPVYVTRSEDTSVESVGYKINDTNSSNKKSLTPPVVVVTPNDNVRDVNDEYYENDNKENHNLARAEDDDDMSPSFPETSGKIRGVLRSRSKYNLLAGRRSDDIADERQVVTTTSPSQCHDECDDDDLDISNDLRDQVEDDDGKPSNKHDPHHREACGDFLTEERPILSPIASNHANGGNKARGRRSSAAIDKSRPSPPTRSMARSAPDRSYVRNPVRSSVPTPSLTQKSVVSGRSDAAIAPSPSGSYSLRQRRGRGERIFRASASSGPPSSQQSVASGWSDVAVVPSSPPHGEHRHDEQRRRQQQQQHHRTRPAGVLREHQRYSNHRPPALSRGDRAHENGPRLDRRRKDEQRKGRRLGLMRSNSNVSNVSFATSGGRSNSALDGVVADDIYGESPRTGNGGVKGRGGGGYSFIQRTRNFFSTNAVRRRGGAAKNKERRHASTSIDVDAYMYDIADDIVERQQLYGLPPSAISSPRKKDVVDLRRLRQRPPLVISSPTNNDGTTMNRQFERCYHPRPPMEVVATSRPTSGADDKTKERMTAADSVNANNATNVNPWASTTGGLSKSGKAADNAVPCKDDDNVQPFPFALNEDVVPSPSGQYDLTTGSGMPSFKWWTWQQHKDEGKYHLMN
ncbi:hypothetical protein ACHAXA_000455 [Cyclostephanos tholiformis]|uniref:Uncharacterized protein n=1 Tax=Cyclostephanos tholiformis TaxID=382380 RepID=A0ABD3RVZ5_9STRA